MPSSYSLYELNEYIRRVIALNFTEPIWVNAEISQIKEVRGNVYMDLVYHDDQTNEIKAQISAGIWFKSYLFLKNKLGSLLPSLLSEGTHVLLKVQVEFTERYGMKLIVEDIDPSFTIGQMEMNRQKILQKLFDEGLTHLNKLTKLPAVIQRIAVISSDNAAGYIDFINHLSQNPYGYQFKTTLFRASLQGQNTEREVCQALNDISEDASKYDCTVIIRGGGSKLDLAWFDNFNIGARIAKSPIPVMTGIGHDINATVADTVAHTTLKTPTATADFIINHNMDFEAKIIETTNWITQLAGRYLRQHELMLGQTNQMLSMLPMEKIKNQHLNIDNRFNQLITLAKNKLRKHQDQITFADKQMEILQPSNMLKKGYTIIRQNAGVVSRLQAFDKNGKTEIEFFDGKLELNTTGKN